MTMNYKLVVGFAALAMSALAGSASAAAEIFMYGAGGHTLQENISARFENSTHFGSVLTDGGTKTHYFYIRNDGDANLIVNAVNITGGGAANFAVTVSPDAVVVPNGFTSIGITFNPTSNGLKSAEVSVGTNAPANSLFDFNIAGTGATTVPDKPDLDVNIITKVKSKEVVKKGINYYIASYIVPISNNGPVESPKKMSSLKVFASTDRNLDDSDTMALKVYPIKKALDPADVYSMKVKVKIALPQDTEKIIFQIESPDDAENKYNNNLRFETF